MAARYWVGGTGDWNSTSRWSTTSGGASGASVPTTSDNVIFDSNSSPSNADFTVSFPSGLSASTTSVEIYTANALTTFNFSGGGTLSCSSLTISATTTADGLRITDSTTTRGALNCSGTTTLTQGLLDLNGNRLVTTFFTSTNSNTRTIAFGSTGSILLPGTNSTTTVWNTSNDANLTLTGSKNVILEGFNITSTRTLTVSLNTSTTLANLFNFIVQNVVFNTSNFTYMQYSFSSPNGNPTMDTLTLNTGNNNVFISGNMVVYGASTVTTGGISGSPNFVSSLTMTGGSISGNPIFQGVLTMTNASISGTAFVYNNVVINNGCSITTLYFTSTQATQTLTLTSNITNLTIDKSSGTVQLQQAIIVTSTTTLTSGTFNLNGFTVTTTFFTSTNSNTRSIAFGSTGLILLPGINSTTTVWNTSNDANLTLTGSKNVSLQGFNITSTRTLTVSLNNSSVRANLFNFNVGDIVFNTSNFTYMQYSFSSPNGVPSMDSFTVNISNANAVVSGNIILYGNLSSLSSYISGTIYFYGTANQTITQTSGSILSIDINKGGGQVSLASNVSLLVSYSITLNAGTLNLNNFALSASFFTSTNSNTRSIAFGSTGSLILLGQNSSTTVWNTSNDANLT